MAADSILSLNLQENQWVIQISQLLHGADLHAAVASPPFIFQLPDSVRNGNPEAYLPRRIALGLLHHFRSELYKMEFYKLEAAKKLKDELHLPDFDQLRDQLLGLELRTRACFNKYFEMGAETVAWTMLVDGLFLLRLLVKVSFRTEFFCRLVLPIPKFDDRDMFHTDNEQIKAHYEILNDVLMLENQIPLLILQGILPTNFGAKLPAFLYPFCVSISPFQLPVYQLEDIVPETPCEDIPLFPNFPKILDQSHHLLHFMYFSILVIPKYLFKRKNESATYSLPPSVTIFQKFLGVSSSILNVPFLSQLNVAIDLIRSLLELLGVVKSQASAQELPPLIPSASQLKKANFKFSSTDHGILEARFNKDSIILVLPVITVNAFTETLFRNLVAFEAMAKIKPPCVAKYTELMDGLLASPKDVKILKDAEIISSDLGSDEEIVKLFNGVRTSISSLKEPSIRKMDCFQKKPSNSEAKEGIFREIDEGYEMGLKGMIEEINEYYEKCWKVKAKRFLKKYVGSALLILAVAVIVFLMFLVVARLVCSFFGCPKLFSVSVDSADGSHLAYV